MGQLLDDGTPPKDTKNVYATGVVPESSYKTPSNVVSRRRQKIIAAGILCVLVGISLGIFLGSRIVHDATQHTLEGGRDICVSTLYPETCNSTLVGADKTSAKSFVSKSMTASMKATTEALRNLTRCRDSWPSKTGIHYSTLQMCIDMYHDIIDVVNIASDTVERCNSKMEATILNDLEQRACAAITYHLTCVKGLQEHGLWNHLTGNQEKLCGGLDTERMTALLSNALSLVEHFEQDTAPVASPPLSRRLLSTPVERLGTGGMVYEMDEEEQELVPAWLSKRDRRLLQSNHWEVHTVVALDGSANYTSIQAAVNASPDNSTVRHVIHVKKGIYNEHVKIWGNKTYLSIIGDGPGRTIITGNRSSRTNNVTTEFTATLSVSGDHFIGKKFTVRNTAGPSGHQAVALRVTSQQSAFSNLSIEGYQDAHYVHTSQQFYTHCTIKGTIDFVFGSAAAVFQKCKLLARLPDPGQVITFTASGIASPLVQKYTGQVFHNCTVGAAEDLAQNGSTSQLAFLGRPWHLYARTVFIKSDLGSLIDPRGWTFWSNNTNISHVVYGEYLNFGPGSNYSHRVPWSHQLTALEAQSYGVDQFIQGNQWLPSYNFSYSAGI